MELNAQDCRISKAVKETSMLPSKIDQRKVSEDVGRKANFGFKRFLMPSYREMCPPSPCPLKKRINETGGNQVVRPSYGPSCSSQNIPRLQVIIMSSA